MQTRLQPLVRATAARPPHGATCPVYLQTFRIARGVFKAIRLQAGRLDKPCCGTASFGAAIYANPFSTRPHLAHQQCASCFAVVFPPRRLQFRREGVGLQPSCPSFVLPCVRRGAYGPSAWAFGLLPPMSLLSQSRFRDRRMFNYYGRVEKLTPGAPLSFTAS